MAIINERIRIYCVNAWKQVTTYVPTSALIGGAATLVATTSLNAPFALGIAVSLFSSICAYAATNLYQSLMTVSGNLNHRITQLEETLRSTQETVNKINQETIPRLNATLDTTSARLNATLDTTTTRLNVTLDATTDVANEMRRVVAQLDNEYIDYIKDTTENLNHTMSSVQKVSNGKLANFLGKGASSEVAPVPKKRRDTARHQPTTNTTASIPATREPAVNEQPAVTPAVSEQPAVVNLTETQANNHPAPSSNNGIAMSLFNRFRGNHNVESSRATNEQENSSEQSSTDSENFFCPLWP